MSNEVNQGDANVIDDELHVYEQPLSTSVNEDASQSQTQTPVGSTPSLNDNDSSQVNTKSLKSKVWEEMTKTVEKGVVVAICHHCEKRLSGKGTSGTKHLSNHLERCPKRKNRDIKQMMLQPTKKGKGNGTVQYQPYVFDENVTRNDLANMIALHEYPLSMVNHEGFRTYSRNLQPLFKMVCRNTIKSEILKIYHSKKVKLVEILESLESRVAITTDMWSAKPTKKGFMAVTAHYVDFEWKLQSRIVRFIYVPPPHSSDVLTEFLVEALIDLNLDRKLSTITVDNATSNDAMLDKIIDRLDPSTLVMRGEILHMRCCAHILNLIVKDGLEVIKDELEKVRSSVVFWIGSRGRIQKFEDTVRQLSLKHTKCLTLDCPTRWNSTYIMLETALLYKVVFPRLKQKDRSYNCVPSEEDWRRVERITEKLKVFYDVTVMFSSTSCPTANEFFVKVCELKLALNAWVSDSEIFISDMAQRMIEKYDKYWGECHLTLGIACVLDPRFKLKLLEYFLPLIYGELAYIEKIEKVRSNCYDLLKEYQSKGNSRVNVSGTSSSNSLIASDSLSGFDMFVSTTSSQLNAKSELDHYLEEIVLPRSPNFDILGWWKTNGVKFPTLQKIARDILAIPVTSVASESAFSTSGRLISPHRSRLAPNTLEALMCLQNWFRNENIGISLKVEDEENMATCNEDTDV